MLEELTVRENIEYSARIRLPRSWSRKEISKFVDAVLEALDLAHVADNLIDRVSGGQRKRVNIGMELVTCPSAIFLDEPTSGLDATGALKIANTMKKIASNIGITVVAVIHQPRFEIFEEFDDLLLIAPGGRTAYMGPRSEVIPYFESIGFYFDPKNNPADVLMDILSGKGKRLRSSMSPILASAIAELPFSSAVTAHIHDFEEYDVMEMVYRWEDKERAIETFQASQQYHHELSTTTATTTINMTTVNTRQFDDDVGSDLTDEADYDASRPPTIFRDRTTSYLTCQSIDARKSLDIRSSLDHAVDMAAVFEIQDRVMEDGSHMDKLSALKDLSGLDKGGWRSDLDKHVTSTADENFSHRQLRKACMDRGANALMQVALSHKRSMIQQYRKVNAFVLEILVAVASGSLMGLAIHSYDGQLYQGLLVYPFTLLSPAPIELVIPILSLIIACAIGLSGAPSGVKIFCEEREIYYREAAAGHNKISYFIGKNISSTYRFILSSLHFTSCFQFFGNTNTMFPRMYLIHLLMFFCVYGLSYAVAMLVKRENAAMIAVCLTIVSAVLCGDGPNINDMNSWGLGWMLDMSYARWGSEAWYSEELLIFDGVFEIYNLSARYFGYVLDRFWLNIFIMFCIGIAWRVVAFLLLVLVNRQKQR